MEYLDGLAQDCGNLSALAMELPQSCAKNIDIFNQNTRSYTHLTW